MTTNHQDQLRITSLIWNYKVPNYTIWKPGGTAAVTKTERPSEDMNTFRVLARTFCLSNTNSMEINLEHKRHTLAHLLAAAVLEMYPHAKVTLGPAIETGFYYDFDFSGGDTPGEDDLKKIQKSMKKLANKWIAWEAEEETPEKLALPLF